MSQFYYTALFQPSTGAIEYPEHFEDKAERDKRARQLESEARVRGEGPDLWKCYTGDEPVEAYLARVNAFQPGGEGEDTENNRIDALAAKAASKTTSVLTAPEVDDRAEARPLPAWAVAQHELESAQLVVDDYQAIVDQYTIRANALDEEASIGGKTTPHLRREAEGARTEVDQAAAKLYKAHTVLVEKQAAYDAVKPVAPKEGKKHA